MLLAEANAMRGHSIKHDSVSHYIVKRQDIFDDNDWQVYRAVRMTPGNKPDFKRVHYGTQQISVVLKQPAVIRQCKLEAACQDW